MGALFSKLGGHAFDLGGEGGNAMLELGHGQRFEVFAHGDGFRRCGPNVIPVHGFLRVSVVFASLVVARLPRGHVPRPERCHVQRLVSSRSLGQEWALNSARRPR